MQLACYPEINFREDAMRRALLTPIAAIVLMFTQVHCLAACAGDLCADIAKNAAVPKSAAVPPCHRHHDHSNDPAPESCAHQTLSAPATVEHAVHLESPNLIALDAAANYAIAALPTDAWAGQPLLADISPPGEANISFAVLRI
jgi:hypothetical protein